MLGKFYLFAKDMKFDIESEATQIYLIASFIVLMLLFFRKDHAIVFFFLQWIIIGLMFVALFESN